MKSKEDINFNIGFDPERVGFDDSGDTSWIDAYEERPRKPKKNKTKAAPKENKRRQKPEARKTEEITDSYDDATVEGEPEEEYVAPKTKKRKKRQEIESSHKREPRELPDFVKFFFDSRTHAVIGIALILIAAYLLVSGMSYFSTSRADQSTVVNMSVDQMVANGEQVGNVGGPVGASVSYFLMTKGWGIGAFALIFYLTVIGLRLVGLKKRIHFWSFTLKCLITTIGISLIIGLLEIALHIDRAFPFGGYHGRYVNLWLIERVGMIGAIAVSGLLAATLVFVYLREITSVIMNIRDRYLASRKPRRQEIHTAEDFEETTAIPTANDLEDCFMDESDSELEIPPHNNITNDGEAPIHATAPQPVAPIISVEPEPLPVDALFNTESEPKTVPHIADSMVENNEIALIDEPDFKVSSKEIEEGVEGDSALYDPTAELSRYHRPTLDLLVTRENKTTNVDLEEQDENKARIIKTLLDYGIPISHIEAKVGPTVTLYEIIPAEGVRIAKIKRLEDDIALSLAALGIRIIAPIPGKGTIGIEVPNKEPQIVSIRSILRSKAYQESKYQLPMAMGATISNEVYIADLAKMPHVLVAGATGQGKSVGLNTIIASLLYKKHPAELKFVLVDPKMVEFSLYNCLRNHFMAQLPDDEDAVVTDMNNVERTLNSLCVEMDNRYDLLRDANVRTIIEYNDKFINRRLNPEKGHRYMPYIVIIVDEFADLIMTSGKAIETPIARIAQKARAVGMHMIIATQRPSTNVITGVIKANFPGRIGFRVSQMVDSKTILDRPGANQLIGRGDMLFSNNGSLERVQCAFIDTPEVEAMVEYISSQPGYDHPYYLPEPKVSDGDISVGNLTDRDPLFEDSARYFCSQGETASTSLLQRRFSIGYNRAAKIMDQLEAANIVGPAQGSKPRAVLIDLMQLDQMLGT